VCSSFDAPAREAKCIFHLPYLISMHVSFFFARSSARRAPRPQSVRVGGLGRGGPHPDRRIEIYLSQTDTRHGGMRVDRCAFRAAGAQHQQRAPASRAHATRRRSPDHTAHTRVTPLVRFSLKYRVKRGWVQTLRGVPFTLYDSTGTVCHSAGEIRVAHMHRLSSYVHIWSRAACPLRIAALIGEGKHRAPGLAGDEAHLVRARVRVGVGVTNSTPNPNPLTLTLTLTP
jgi:hypothetical protein